MSDLPVKRVNDLLRDAGFADMAWVDERGCGKRLFVPYLKANPTADEIAAQIEIARTWEYVNLPPPLIGLVFGQVEIACGERLLDGGATVYCGECRE